MRDEYRAKLEVNKKSIELNPFVEDFLSRVSIGIIKSLKGVEKIEDVEIRKKGDDLNILVNSKPIVLIEFPVMIIEHTLVGLISALKGVDSTESFCISVKSK